MVGVKGRSGGHNCLPTRIKELRGTIQPYRLNPDEPKPKTLSKKPPAPLWLNPEAKSYWRRHVNYLVPLRVLAVGDLPMLEMLCALEGRMMVAIRDGQDLSASKISRIQSLSAEFGLTPSSRSKVKAETPSDNDDLETLLNQNLN